MIESLTVPQRAGERRFSSIVELLETDKGERLVRFAYATGGSARRAPVTLRELDLARLHTGLTKAPGLEEVLCASRPAGPTT